MSDYVLDASALHCLILGEPGAGRVEERLSRSVVGTVNLAEFVTRLADGGAPRDTLRSFLRAFDRPIIPLDRDTAELAGLMRVDTRRAGLSLGDRCCLALAKCLGAVAVTADRDWAAVDVGVSIELVR